MPKNNCLRGTIITYCLVGPFILTVHPSERRQAEIVQMEASIRKLNRKRGASESGSEDDERRDKKTMKRQGSSYLEAEMAKYTTRKVERDKDGKKKRKDESDILAALNSFKGQLKRAPKSAAPHEADDTEGESMFKIPGSRLINDCTGNPEEEGIEVDDDKTWLAHELHFPKDDGAETERAERDYEVIDPRNRSARAKEEEAERKRNQRRNRAGRR
jgi:peptidyl-prolyl cis-trans isomerase SDCCAG10